MSGGSARLSVCPSVCLSATPTCEQIILKLAVHARACDRPRPEVLSLKNLPKWSQSRQNLLPFHANIALYDAEKVNHCFLTEAKYGPPCAGATVLLLKHTDCLFVFCHRPQESGPRFMMKDRDILVFSVSTAQGTSGSVIGSSLTDISLLDSKLFVIGRSKSFFTLHFHLKLCES